jgi:hypothetical protein
VFRLPPIFATCAPDEADIPLQFFALTGLASASAAASKDLAPISASPTVAVRHSAAATTSVVLTHSIAACVRSVAESYRAFAAALDADTDPSSPAAALWRLMGANDALAANDSIVRTLVQGAAAAASAASKSSSSSPALVWCHGRATDTAPASTVMPPAMLALVVSLSSSSSSSSPSDNATKDGLLRVAFRYPPLPVSVAVCI